MGIKAKDVAGRLSAAGCLNYGPSPTENQLKVLRNLLPGKWPVWTDLPELTGRDVQAGYFGEWPEPSRVAICKLV